jgi:DNA-binding MarR family transcriptional regulator
VTAESGRRLVTLTDAGREHVAEHSDEWADPFGGTGEQEPGADLRRLMHELTDAARQVGRAGDDAQRAAAATILTDARRSLYLLLADGPREPTT